MDVVAGEIRAHRRLDAHAVLGHVRHPQQPAVLPMKVADGACDIAPVEGVVGGADAIDAPAVPMGRRP
jgi:hypothetical protein